jgi:hypothetical protein
MNLDEIGLKFGTDKASNSNNFLEFYERFFCKRRFEKLKILEIGVLGGSSLRTWEEYFPNAKIIGLDISLEAKKEESQRIKIEILDQSDTFQLSKYAEDKNFDIIIDDGSHVWGHQIKTLRILFPILNPLGIYIVEDLDTSYGKYYRDYSGDGTRTAASYLHEISDWVVGHRQMSGDELNDQSIASIYPTIDSITYYRGTSLILKN